MCEICASLTKKQSKKHLTNSVFIFVFFNSFLFSFLHFSLTQTQPHLFAYFCKQFLRQMCFVYNFTLDYISDTSQTIIIASPFSPSTIPTVDSLFWTKILSSPLSPSLSFSCTFCVWSFFCLKFLSCTSHLEFYANKSQIIKSHFKHNETI